MFDEKDIVPEELYFNLGGMGVQPTYLLNGRKVILFTTAFRWFMDNHKLFSISSPMLDKWVIEIQELNGYEGNPPVIGYPDLEYDSYHESVISRLKNLMEIVKNRL